MRKYRVVLCYLHTTVQMDFDALSVKDALDIFWDVLTEEEGCPFADNAKKAGQLYVRRLENDEP